MSLLKEKVKKCKLPIILFVLGVLASPLIYKAWVEHQAKTKEVVQREMGLALPSGVEVQDAQVQLFSLADGVNYDWLLAGSTSLLPWARSVVLGSHYSNIHYVGLVNIEVIQPIVLLKCLGIVRSPVPVLSDVMNLSMEFKLSGDLSLSKSCI